MKTAFNFYVIQTEQGDGRMLFCRVFRAPIGCGFTSTDAQVWTRYGEWKPDTADYRETHKHFRTYARAHAAMVDLAHTVQPLASLQELEAMRRENAIMRARLGMGAA